MSQNHPHQSVFETLAHDLDEAMEESLVDAALLALLDTICAETLAQAAKEDQSTAVNGLVKAFSEMETTDRAHGK